MRKTKLARDVIVNSGPSTLVRSQWKPKDAGSKALFRRRILLACRLCALSSVDRSIDLPTGAKERVVHVNTHMHRGPLSRGKVWVWVPPHRSVWKRTTTKVEQFRPTASRRNRQAKTHAGNGSILIFFFDYYLRVHPWTRVPACCFLPTWFG